MLVVSDKGTHVSINKWIVGVYLACLILGFRKEAHCLVPNGADSGQGKEFILFLEKKKKEISPCRGNQ